jgi:Fe-S-cluster containining protein
MMGEMYQGKPMQNILERYSRLLDSVDDWFERSAAAAHPHVQCAPGCSACCRGLFDISLLDAWLLNAGFKQLDRRIRQEVAARSERQMQTVRRSWPDLSPPYVLNARPPEEWEGIMPEDDATPCPLLSMEGMCRVYPFRPMICRHHGIPNIDISGELFSERWCSLNFVAADPLAMMELRWDFRALFAREFDLAGELSTRLLGIPVLELDTVIPAAVLMDYENFDWGTWWKSRKM